MNNAIYVVNLGTEDSPLCRIGVCALADVPNDAEFVVTSPDSEKIFRRMKDVEEYLTKCETVNSIDCEKFPCLVADDIRLRCEGALTASP